MLAAINQEEQKHEETQPMAAFTNEGNGPNIIGNQETLLGRTPTIVDPNQLARLNFGNQSTPTPQQNTDEDMYNPITPKRTLAHDYRMAQRSKERKERKEK